MRYSIYLFAFICLGISSCASIPKLSPEQVTQINTECNADAVCVIEKTDVAVTALVVQREYARENRRTIDNENWTTCAQIYLHAGVPTIHRDHTHGKRSRIYPWMVKYDLMYNRCRGIMGRKYWVEYSD